jgi:hypothetical protein
MMAIRLVTEANILHSMVAMGSEKNKLHCGRLLFLPSHHYKVQVLIRTIRNEIYQGGELFTGEIL